jgi:L-arabinose isomerase
VAAAAWNDAGRTRHTGFSQALTAGHLEEFAGMAGIEFLCIDADTRLRSFRDLARAGETERPGAAAIGPIRGSCKA